MKVRSLSPTSFWIGMPLTPHTPALLWRAMSACGLVRGKINSSATTHFSVEDLERQCVVQGLTPPGLFARNVLIQARLRPDENGVRVELDAANAKGDFDFGLAAQLKREFTANLESFFRSVGTDWEQQIEAEGASSIAPIAAPTSPETEIHTRYEAPEFGVVLPFDHEAPYRQLRYVLYFGSLYLANLLGYLTPTILILCCWGLWEWRRGQKMVWWEPLLLIGASIFEFGHEYMHWF